MESSGRSRLRSLIGPGLLVAATGVGAGDLATGAFAGNKVGLAVLWAVAVGAILKFVLNEGLARWQLATGETLLEGATRRFGLIFPVIFLLYFVVWSFLVALALMSACGVTAHAMIPVFEDAGTAKIVFGIVHSLLGVALVLAGGYGLFEKVMRVCIGGMFAVVVVTAIMLWPGTSAVVQGLFVPASETLEGQKLDWTVALLGGVGGTVTVLCYGYWLREENREGLGEVSSCRTDLAVAYVMTALFGIAMVIIGNSVELPEGKGATLIVRLADRLDEPLGTAGKWAFLIGAWGAVFSSLLGVWQAVPYLFGDLC
ncbi:MAG: Nramp family divalent metal transporter, partial [Planctomycetota bacterium]